MDFLYYYYVTKNWFIYKFRDYFSCNFNNDKLEALMKEAHGDSSNKPNNSIQNKNDDVKLEPFETIQK